MSNIFTMTFIVCLLSSNLVWAQGFTAPITESKELSNSIKSMSQNEWKQILQDLKSGKKASLSDGKTIRVEGPGTSGGGNAFEAEFYYLANQLFKDFAAENISNNYLELAKKSLAVIQNTKSVFFAEEKLILDGREKTAINDYDVFTVIINEASWNEMSFEQKRSLILHELLGLARAFDKSSDDSAYQISKDLFDLMKEKAQMNWLKNSDYPKFFKPVSDRNLVLSSSSANSESRYTGNSSDVCPRANYVKMNVGVNLSVEQNGHFLKIDFEINCRDVKDGFDYGGYQDGGAGPQGTIEIISGNILRLDCPYGRFIIGWISGDDIFIRTPALTMSLTKKSDGTYDFNTQFKRTETKTDSTRANLRSN